MSSPGSFTTKKKDGTIYYRSSITYKNKHISLGSYSSDEDASNAYQEASEIISGNYGVNDYPRFKNIYFEKYITLINFRDNDVYIKNPIYMMQHYFLYYLSDEIIFKFDIDDLFFYSTHKITRRGNHYFVADYGMQLNIHSRYGIRRHAVEGRDFKFVNGDRYDYRYENIEIINHYYGVEKTTKNNKIKYKSKIFHKGNHIIGTYSSEIDAAIAYNKAADVISSKHNKTYDLNYTDEITPSEYATIYTKIKISSKIYEI